VTHTARKLGDPMTSNDYDDASPEQAALKPADEAAPGRGNGDHVQPVMDRAVYDELAEEIGEETACEMLDIFLEETVARLALLHRLSCPNDCVQIEREAHSLKGTAGTFGFKQLSKLSRRLEVGASGMSDAEFRMAFGQIEQAFNAARAQLPAQFAVAK
jgi:histidine phosphotransfer protein HptB